jgi:RNA-directed DNA polymerase
MAKRTDQRPVTVPFGATPSGQPPPVREWANRVVWKEHMLTALEQGVRGGKWHTLSDKVYQPINLWVASQTVLGNQGAAGVDHQTVEQFGKNELAETQLLADELRTEQYRPQAVRRVWIPLL